MRVEQIEKVPHFAIDRFVVDVVVVDGDLEAARTVNEELLSISPLS